MAFREKFNALAGQAASKANSLAAGAANKANAAIENGRLNLKISGEEKKIDTYTLNIGQLMLDKLDAGEQFDDEVMALYTSIQASRQVIAAARADIEANRQAEDAEAAEAADGPFCPNCGKPVAGEDRFCAQCGAKLQAEAPAETSAEAEEAAPEEPAGE